ncbi:MAG: hypothetical protein HYU76_01070 [Betaproteobacteria bacterium]|nr:hypothetical protein [Betaproteobacteria bacterium]
MDTKVKRSPLETSAARRGSSSTGCRSNSDTARSAPTICSCKTWSRARPTSRSGRKRSRRLSGWRCGPTITPSAPTAVTRIRSPAALRWLACFSEQAIIGAAMGAAMTGLRPIAEIMFSDFLAVCFFGDGTANIGAFHAALNFSAVWKLPVVFVCENNFYMEYTPIGAVTAVEHPAADRAGAYGLEPVLVDGNDADEVYRTAMKYMTRARKGGGPALIEATTYRHSGHSRADPAKYRPEGELDKWLERDPIKVYRERLLKFGVAEATLKDIESGAMRKVDEATAIAKASPPPSLDGIDKHVWADGGAAWRN